MWAPTSSSGAGCSQLRIRADVLLPVAARALRHSQAAGTSSGDLEAVAGKFFLDREPAATHLSMAFTKEDEAARDALWEECIRVCEFDPDAAPGGSPKAGAAAAAGASSATSSDARA